jgi:hypothetical protein
MNDDFRLERHPVLLLQPSISAPYGWVGHIPFAYLLVDLLKPRCLVELGTDAGNSYLAFCQAVQALQLPTACFAVDTWQGDQHARHYGDEVYQRLKAQHDPRYGQFSRLLRRRFEQAVGDFADGSIDLLHIDGFHSYEAVREDFESWLPKLSDQAVVLLHDTQVEGREFGVGRYFGELKQRYPSFEFTHAHGLAVVAVGPRQVPAFAAFLEHARQHAPQLREFFEALAARLISAEDGLPVADSAQPVEAVFQLYYRAADESFADLRSLTLSVPGASGRRALQVALPAGCRPDYLRIDPAEFPGIYAVTELSLHWDGCSIALDDLSARLGHVNGNWLANADGGPQLVSFSDDPYFEFFIGDLLPVGHAETAWIVLSVQLDYQAVIDNASARRLVGRQGQAMAHLLALAQTHGEMRVLAAEMRQSQQSMAGQLDEIRRALREQHELAGLLHQRLERMGLRAWRSWFRRLRGRIATYRG